MKRILTFFVIIAMIFLTSFKASAQNQQPEYKLLYDTTITMLTPYITDEVINYYGYSKQFDLFNADIKNIERTDGFSFQIKILVKTFEAAHNPPYGNETITFEIDPAGVKTLDFRHDGDKYEKIIENFYNEALADIKQSFNLDLSGYKEYNYNQIFHLAISQDTYKSLSNITKDIVFNILKPEKPASNKNVIEPVTYIKGNNGYILFKLSDGTNVVYRIKKENDIWLIKNKEYTEGKKMKYELLWYM